METRTLLIKQSDGKEIQIDIPSDWKITFGPMYTKEKGYGSVPTALRIYESEKMQRAVFIGVECFRDISIPVRYKQVTTEGKDEWVDNDEMSKRSSTRKHSAKWVDDKTK